MGKYRHLMESYKNNETTDVVLAVTNYWIANELAEANRLKRWELKKKYPQKTYSRILDKQYDNYKNEELEDQA